MTQEIDDRPEWERRYDRIDATLDRIAEQQDRNTKGLAETETDRRPCKHRYQHGGRCRSAGWRTVSTPLDRPSPTATPP